MKKQLNQKKTQTIRFQCLKDYGKFFFSTDFGGFYSYILKIARLRQAAIAIDLLYAIHCIPLYKLFALYSMLTLFALYSMHTLFALYFMHTFFALYYMHTLFALYSMHTLFALYYMHTLFVLYSLHSIL